ncbi:hypothetical protein VNO80_02467 [Phaseolus coccineus]|uniref:DUF1230 domain-containing protein n=1 Tax=Phaseolus coccineus TaxID=3886 RepID=A0AAN9NU81_PHACN
MAMAAIPTRISPLSLRRSRGTVSPIPLFGILFTRTATSRSPSLLSFASTSSNSNNNAPQTDCPVPLEQQPINEYHSLSTSFPFSWAALDAIEYASRLFVTGTSFALLVGLPVAWFGSAGAQAEPFKRLLCAASSGLFAVTLAVVRMYLGWAYVGNRLLSATVEYEETGWYDGQIWVKTAEVLARDRLLGSFSVKPVLSRLKITLVSLATSLLVCALILINIDGDQNLISKEPRVRVVPGVYSDNSARLFEPDAFRDEPELQ